MIEIHTTIGCPYCDALIEWLELHEVDYEECVSNIRRSSYPRIYYRGKLRFVGLPKATELHQLLLEIENDYA